MALTDAITNRQKKIERELKQSKLRENSLQKSLTDFNHWKKFRKEAERIANKAKKYHNDSGTFTHQQMRDLL